MRIEHPVDFKRVEGSLTFMARKLPYIPLEDLSGVVVKIGSSVKRFKPVCRFKLVEFNNLV
jgi:NADPH:quinone reductase-like Zn-dependent oxidoreductase